MRENFRNHENFLQNQNMIKVITHCLSRIHIHIMDLKSPNFSFSQTTNNIIVKMSLSLGLGIIYWDSMNLQGLKILFFSSIFAN